MKKAQLKSILVSMLVLVVLASIAIAAATFTITFIKPVDDYWSTSQTVEFNFTVAGNYTEYVCSWYTNNTNSWRDLYTNNTVANDTPTVFSYTLDNELPGNIWNILCSKNGTSDFGNNSAGGNYTLNIDSIPLTTALNYPPNGSYLSDTTPDFNVTITDSNPNACILYLSNHTAGDVIVNLTAAVNTTSTGIPIGSPINITQPSIMPDGAYKYNIGCNDSSGFYSNVSDTLLDLTIDTVDPAGMMILSTWHQTNSTDTMPILFWNDTTDTNFDRYVVDVINVSDGTSEEQITISSSTTNYTNISGLSTGSTYNFSVTAYDLAGNTGISSNTTDTWYYVDPICGTLFSGWNTCGIVATTVRNLSVIGEETSATFVTVWNSSHQWQTCTYGVSETNCDVVVGVDGVANLTSVWVYVASDTAWRNRTWSATKTSDDVYLSNLTIGWNAFGLFTRNGRTYEQLNATAALGMVNVTAYSLFDNEAQIYTPYINKDGFNTINKATKVEYGESLWVFYNGTGTSAFDVGGW